MKGLKVPYVGFVDLFNKAKVLGIDVDQPRALFRGLGFTVKVVPFKNGDDHVVLIVGTVEDLSSRSLRFPINTADPKTFWGEALTFLLEGINGK